MTRKRKYSLGWIFTKAEEEAMARIIKKSIEYMETYGNGRKPRMFNNKY